MLLINATGALHLWKHLKRQAPLIAKLMAAYATEVVCTYLVDCLALVLLIPGPFLHEGIQQQPPHMDDCQAGVGSRLLH